MSEELFVGVSSGEISRSKGDTNKVPAGTYPELRLVKCEIFKSQSGARCFKATCEVLVPANGVAEGGLVEIFEKLEQNSHESYNRDARARTMQFVGALFGFEKTSDVDANINGKVLMSVVDKDTQPMTGTVFGGTVGYKNEASIFAKWSFKPVFGADGKPKVVRGKLAGGPAKVEPKVEAPVQTFQPGMQAFFGTSETLLVPSTPAPVPVPVSAVPAGWAVHPQDARFIYELANTNNMKQVG